MPSKRRIYRAPQTITVAREAASNSEGNKPHERMPRRVCEYGHLVAGTIDRCAECGSDVVFGVGKSFRDDDDENSGEEAEHDTEGLLRVFALGEGKHRPVKRIPTGTLGFDRVLGGPNPGMAEGSVVLLAGPPGSGKSTLAMKTAAYRANSGEKVLYATGEQNAQEVSGFATRLGAVSKSLYIAETKNVEEIIAAIRKLKPSMAVVDSVNTIYSILGTEGEVAQIKQCAKMLVDAAKKDGFALVLIGHVTKDDDIGGPKQLEHLVDATLIYSVAPNNRRYLTSKKNRNGPAGEIAIFDMAHDGLREISMGAAFANFLKAEPSSGHMVFPSATGSRPFLMDVESRVSTDQTPGVVGERRFVGLDGARIPAIMAILKEDAKLNLMGRDVFVDASSILGDTNNDSAIDLAAAAAIAGAADGIRLAPGIVVCGTIGLSGRIKSVDRIRERLSASLTAGFKAALIPKDQEHESPSGIKTYGLSSLSQLREWMKTHSDKRW
jgi:DNA repair protein RadA/Sms